MARQTCFYRKRTDAEIDAQFQERMLVRNVFCGMSEYVKLPDNYLSEAGIPKPLFCKELQKTLCPVSLESVAVTLRRFMYPSADILHCEK